VRSVGILPRTEGEPPVDDASLPSLLDTTKPTIARVYDASLGGKDNFDVDRRVWERIRGAAPH
jgi:S-adenosyl methyltransferase